MVENFTSVENDPDLIKEVDKHFANLVGRDAARKADTRITIELLPPGEAFENGKLHSYDRVLAIGIKSWGDDPEESKRNTLLRGLRDIAVKDTYFSGGRWPGNDQADFKEHFHCVIDDDPRKLIQLLTLMRDNRILSHEIYVENLKRHIPQESIPWGVSAKLDKPRQESFIGGTGI